MIGFDCVEIYCKMQNNFFVLRKRRIDFFFFNKYFLFIILVLIYLVFLFLFPRSYVNSHHYARACAPSLTDFRKPLRVSAAAGPAALPTRARKRSRRPKREQSPPRPGRDRLHCHVTIWPMLTMLCAEAIGRRFA